MIVTCASVRMMVAFVVALGLTPALQAQVGQPLRLASGGRSLYVIVHPAGAHELEIQAAKELQSYLRQISGAELPVQEAGRTLPERAILVGALDVPGQSLPALSPHGYLLKTLGPRLLIRGGSPNGTLYGVYGLLEDHLGVRFYSPEVEKVPRQPALTIPALNDHQEPAFPWYRSVYQQDAQYSKTWSMKLRLGGTLSGASHHNLHSYIPPAKFFDQHPEWYPLRNGQRSTGDSPFLCFTNPQLQQEMTRAVLEKMKDQPEDALLPVGQGDWFGACRCESCVAMYQADGGTASGALLRFLNGVLEETAKVHPHKRIITFAYKETERPCTVKPHPNLVVQLTHWRRDDLHSMMESDHQVTMPFIAGWDVQMGTPLLMKPMPFLESLRGWSQLTDKLYVWHYIVNFKAYQMPWPNLHAIGPDLRSYQEAGVKGMFLQGLYNSRGGEFSFLRIYLCAKLLWNPAGDTQRILKDFAEGYYGPAAPKILAYIELLHRAVPADLHLNAIGHGPAEVAQHILTPQVVAQADRLFDEAEALVARNPDLAARVAQARLPLLFMKLVGPHQLKAAEGVLAPEGDRRYLQLAERFTQLIGNQALEEHSAAWVQHHRFRQRLGSRMTTLENPALRLEVAPALGGKTYRLIDKRSQRNLLADASPADKGYPTLIGGLRESYAGPNFTVHPPILDAEQTQAFQTSLRGPLYHGEWGRGYPADVLRHIRLDPREIAASFTTSAQNVTAEDQTITTTVSVDLAIENITRTEVSIEAADGQQQTFMLDGKLPLKLPATAEGGPARAIWVRVEGREPAVGLVFDPAQMAELSFHAEPARGALCVTYVGQAQTIPTTQSRTLISYSVKLSRQVPR